MRSIADVFIIESLDPDDEGNGRLEGGSISHLLRLHDKNPKYTYVRTRDQLWDAIDDFALSNYRYLHISAHGDRQGMVTTNLDDITNSELTARLAPVLSGKRLFLSACSMVHRKMAGEIILKTGCSSVIGPRTAIGFSEAAVFWPAVYHMLFKKDSEKVTRATLRDCLAKVADLLEIEIGYYAKSGNKTGYTKDVLKV